jgi:hypothetical protein
MLTIGPGRTKQRSHQSLRSNAAWGAGFGCAVLLRLMPRIATNWNELNARHFIFARQIDQKINLGIPSGVKHWTG